MPVLSTWPHTVSIHTATCRFYPLGHIPVLPTWPHTGSNLATYRFYPLGHIQVLPTWPHTGSTHLATYRFYPLGHILVLPTRPHTGSTHSATYHFDFFPIYHNINIVSSLAQGTKFLINFVCSSDNIVQCS